MIEDRRNKIDLDGQLAGAIQEHLKSAGDVGCRAAVLPRSLGQ